MYIVRKIIIECFTFLKWMLLRPDSFISFVHMSTLKRNNNKYLKSFYYLEVGGGPVKVKRASRNKLAEVQGIKE